MKINMLTKRVIGVVFGLSLLLGIGIASSTVQAQWRDPQWERQQQREQIRRQREWEREQRRRQRQAQRDWRYDRDGRYDGRYDDNYSNYGGNQQMRQNALNAGYNEGIKEGRKDRNNGERFEYRDEEDFRNANTGYSSRFGDRQLYAQYFREAFINGYTDGYRGY